MYSTKLCKKLVPSAMRHDLSMSLNVDVISAFSKNALGMSCAKLFSYSNTTVYPDKRPFLRPNSGTISSILGRSYCKDYRPFPEVPEFPPVVWPNLFKSIKTLLYTYLIIKPQWDKDFNLSDFSKNSRKVLAHSFFSTVSQVIIIFLIPTYKYL